jgi:hypothetical protein
MRRYIPAVILAACMVPGVAGAQFLASDSEDPSPSFSISVSPEYPTPYENATLTFLSSSVDLTGATLTVLANGKQLYKGTVQPVVVPLAGAGSVISITATVAVSGSVYEERVSIQPQDVVLIAEPIASVPPLYPGKPSIPVEGSVRIVAVANFKNGAGAALNPSALSYAWTIDDTRIANASGVGKQVIVAASPLEYRSRSVSVIVRNADGSLVGGASLPLAPSQPLMRVYENDPLLGIRFERALLGTYRLSNSEASLYAAPFSLPISNGSPVINWFLNGEPAQSGPVITLRPTGSGSGEASLSAVASVGAYATANAVIPIQFGSSSGGFFGL